MSRKTAQNPFTRWRPGDKTQGVNPDWAGWVKDHRNFLVRIISWKNTNKHGPDILLWWPHVHNGLRSSFAINLTDLTEAELDAVKKFLIESIEIARPVVLERDRIAKEEYDAGRDVDIRVYRSVPEVVIRPWAVNVNPESILDGPPDAFTGFRPDGGSTEQPGDDSSTVAELDEADGSQAQDDEPSPDEYQGLRVVGDGQAGPHRLFAPDTSQAFTPPTP